MNIDDFFVGYENARPIFEAVLQAVGGIGATELHVTKSQIAFRRHRAFAWVWVPGKYLTGRIAPLVLTIALRRRDTSPRWKEVVEPAPGRFTHHLEVRTVEEVDNEVARWLTEAWSIAG